MPAGCLLRTNNWIPGSPDGIMTSVDSSFGPLACAAVPAKAVATAKALDELEKDLAAVETQMYQVKNRSDEDTLNFPIMLNNRLEALQGAVESADAAPTAQCIDVFRVLSSKVDDQLSRLDRTIKTELPRVNRLLQKQKLPPIKAEPLT